MGVCIRLFLDSSYISAGPPKLDRAHSGVFRLQLFCCDHHLLQRPCQPAGLPDRIQPLSDPFPPGPVGGKAHRRADLLSGGHRHQLYHAGRRRLFILRHHQSAQRDFCLDAGSHALKHCHPRRSHCWQDFFSGPAPGCSSKNTCAIPPTPSQTVCGSSWTH